jgi:hypothetical protein
MTKINRDRHIWEGWTVGSFIDELEPMFDMLLIHSNFLYKPFATKEEVRKWCMENQPYYKKHIPEVVEYFYSKL